MLQSVMIRQATKAGAIKWQVGGSRSFFPYIKDEKRQSAGERKCMPHFNGK